MESRGSVPMLKLPQESETLVNESIVVFPLFNVKICDIFYLKCCIYYERT